MVEILIDDILENLSKEKNILLKQMTLKAHQLSLQLGFKPANKINLIACYPGLTVANKESEGLINIFLDRSILYIENKEVMYKTVIFHITHELSHASIAEMGLLDIVHYNIFGGRFVTQDSNEEFNHIVSTLYDNINVDSVLCKNKLLLNGFLLNNMYEFVNLKNKIAYVDCLKRNYDTFRTIIEVLHISVVSRFLKDNIVVNGINREMATAYGELFHMDLKGHIGNPIINSDLQEIYKELLKIPYNKGNLITIKSKLYPFWLSKKLQNN